MSIFFWPVQTVGVLSPTRSDPKKPCAMDTTEPLNMDDYITLLEEKARASHHLVDALLRKSSDKSNTGPAEDSDHKLHDNQAEGPLILNF